MTAPVYIPLSLYEKFFEKFQSDSNSPTEGGKRALIVRRIKTYPVGFIVVDIESNERKANGEDEFPVTVAAIDVTRLPFYKNGDFLSEPPDFELVQNEIQADLAFIKVLLSKSSGNRYITSLIHDSDMTREEVVKHAAVKFTDSNGVDGYASPQNREEWLKKSRNTINGTWNQTWRQGALNCMRHYIAQHLDSKNIRGGDGIASDRSTYPHFEYVRVWNAIVQLTPQLSRDQQLNLRATYTERSATATLKLLESMELPTTLVPTYLGDLSPEYKHKLNNDSFDWPKENGTRRADPPLPCYYNQKANKLESGGLTKVRKHLANTLAGDGIDAPENVAARMMVVCFDHFMHGAKVTKHRSGTSFESYVPKSKASIIEDLPDPKRIALQDNAITSRILGRELIRQTELDDFHTHVGAGSNGSMSTSIVDELDHREMLESRLQRAGVDPFDQYVYREMHELPIPNEQRVKYASVFDAMSDQDKLSKRVSVYRKVLRAAATNRQSSR